MTARLERTLEALLFLSAEPVAADALADATEAELHEVVTALERLREHYEFERRGLVLRELAGGWVLSTHPDAEPAARRLLARPRTPPLTPAQAETLAIVAYLQPVSRPEIARIRGVNAESAAATLLERGLIEEAGRSQFGAVLYRTTELFLRLFGLATRSTSCPMRGSSTLARARGRAARPAAAGRRGARQRIGAPKLTKPAWTANHDAQGVSRETADGSSGASRKQQNGRRGSVKRQPIAERVVDMESAESSASARYRWPCSPRPLTISAPWVGWWTLAPLGAAALAFAITDRGLEDAQPARVPNGRRVVGGDDRDRCERRADGRAEAARRWRGSHSRW